MSFLSKLFGGGNRAESEPTEHNGFAIFPDPVSESGGYRVNARIEKDGQVHHLIRADVIASRDEAVEVTVSKAKQVIDSLGDGIFR